MEVETVLMHEIDLDSFAAAHAAGGYVIDVREPDEYVDGHVPGARLMPLSRLSALAAERAERPAGVCDLRVRQPQQGRRPGCWRSAASRRIRSPAAPAAGRGPAGRSSPAPTNADRRGRQGC